MDVTAMLTPYRLQKEQEETDFERELRRAEMGNRASSIMGESIARDQAQQERVAAGRERLAMTPGVRSGGRPRGVPTVADELMRPESFTRYGQSYTFDPAMEAAGEGAAAGLRQTTAEQTRLQALRNIPGITPTMANRMVMGRTGMVDEEGEQSALRAALAEYVRTPSRDAAARAVQAGAALNSFPDRFLSGTPEPPVRGTPEYLKMLEQEGQVELGLLERAAPIRANATAATRIPREPWELRAASTDVAARRREHQASLRTRPRPSQFMDPMTRQLLPEPYREAMEGFRADSTATADALKAAQDQLRAASGEEPVPADAPVVPVSGAPTAAEGAAGAPVAEPSGEPDQAAIALEMQDAITRIMASKLSAAEKRRRVEAVNARGRELLGGRKR